MVLASDARGGNKFVLVLLPRGCGVSTSVASCAHHHRGININSRRVYFGVNLLKKMERHEYIDRFSSYLE